MKTVPLSDLADLIRGVTFKPADKNSDGVGVMRTKNVQETLDLSDIIRVSPAHVKRKEQYLQPGDTLISSANSWYAVGKACWVPELDQPLAIGGFVTALRPRAEAVDARYLYRWFTSPRTQATLRSFSNKTTNIANLNLKLTAAMPVPLPTPTEQRRIADILDHADALRAKRRQVLSQLDLLNRAIFRDLVGVDYWRAVSASASGETESGWPWVLLSDVSRLATGHTPDRKRSDYWDGGRIPWISLPEIRSLDGQTAINTDLAITEAGLANSSAVLLPAGTVCFSRTASVGFVTTLGVPMATSQDFHNWVPGPDLDSAYLMSALRYSRRHLLSVSDGSIHRTIYQRTAKSFRVLLPPMELQREFAKRAESVAEQRRAAQRAFATDDELFLSLQARAFRGEL